MSQSERLSQIIGGIAAGGQQVVRRKRIGQYLILLGRDITAEYRLPFAQLIVHAERDLPVVLGNQRRCRELAAGIDGRGKVAGDLHGNGTNLRWRKLVWFPVNRSEGRSQ